MVLREMIAFKPKIIARHRFTKEISQKHLFEHPFSGRCANYQYYQWLHPTTPYTTVVDYPYISFKMTIGTTKKRVIIGVNPPVTSLWIRH